MKIVREKLQYEVPANHNEDELSGWASDSSARVKKGTPSGLEARFNRLPPGMDNSAQEVADIRKMPFGGQLGSGSQVTDDVTKESLRKGFSFKPLSSTDGQAHQDAFYDEVTVDGETGFLERNNVLDRT